MKESVKRTRLTMIMLLKGAQTEICSRSSRDKSDDDPSLFGYKSQATAKVHLKELVFTRGSDGTDYESDDEQISWKSSNEEDDDDDDERQEEVNEEDSFDPRVQTPSHVESTDDDDNDDEIQGANVMGEEMDEEATNAEGEENELYRDVNVNLEGRDTTMTDALLPNVNSRSFFCVIGFVSNMLNPRPDTGIDSIFNLNTEATSLIDVSITTIAEPPLVFATTLPPSPTPLITHMQQTPLPTPTIVPISSL
ncbi:hypothetical protein Tco_0527110 [Tanacetum coccineum]